ncbi:MAG TPA: tetratricopeptide repeat protein [Thermoanaerobaculia bacterium]|nr:tetratricopeptide repeat protein [Thermoanaerobaculia bacterium]
MKPKQAAPPPPPPPPRRSPLAWAVVLLLALALLGQTGRMRDRITAGKMLRQVELLSMAAIARNELPSGLVPSNLELLRRAQTLAPSEIGVHIARGTQYLLLGNGITAAQAYREALKLEPRPETYLNLGRALAAAGQMEEAREQFRLALKLDPRMEPMVPAELR